MKKMEEREGDVKEGDGEDEGEGEGSEGGGEN